MSRVTAAGLEGSLTTFQRLQEQEAFETLGSDTTVTPL
jgi:hypothetical protein